MSGGRSLLRLMRYLELQWMLAVWTLMRSQWSSWAPCQAHWVVLLPEVVFPVFPLSLRGQVLPHQAQLIGNAKWRTGWCRRP